MINMVTQEYREGNLAVRTTVVTFLYSNIQVQKDFNKQYGSRATYSYQRNN